MAEIEILGKTLAVDFVLGEGAAADALDEDALLAGARDMAALINSKDWPPHFRDAFREMVRIVFFEGKVEVNGHLMDRPCCDEDDAVFYWEANEFLLNSDADVRANTFFHDCWHVVQFKLAGRQFAYTEEERLRREVDAITHQIGVAHTLGCNADEIGHLEAFRGDQQRIAARLDEGVGQIAPHRAGGMALNA